MKIELLGVKVDNLTEAEAVKKIEFWLSEKKKFWIATPNPEMVVHARQDLEFRKILNSADLAIPDGQGLIWAAKILGKEGPLTRVTGTDLMARLCQEAAKEGWGVFFLGGKEGMAKEALEVLQRRFPDLKGVALAGPQKLSRGAGSRFAGEIGDPEREREAKREINQFEPDLLFVGFGMGKQERWVLEHLRELKIGGAMVVGGAFDFYAGKVRRAPLWIREIGLEWFWRLLLEPWRWQRQLNLGKFICLVLKKKLGLD